MGNWQERGGCDRISPMPVTKSAKKKLRGDKRKTIVNKLVRARMNAAVKRAKKNPGKKEQSEMYTALDRAVKQKITSKNKAARIKARVAKQAKKSVLN